MQSSANILIVEDTLCGRSLIKMRKSKGPKMLPCGTPEVTSVKEDEKLFAMVNW